MTINRRAVIGASAALAIPPAVAAIPVRSDAALLEAADKWREAQRHYRALDDAPEDEFGAAVTRADECADTVLSLRATTRAGVEAKAAAIDERFHGFYDEVVYDAINSLLDDLRGGLSSVSAKRRHVRSKNDVSYNRLRELLVYDPESGLFSWKGGRGRGTRPEGSPAGTRHVDGYVQIRVDYKLYMAHVLAWFYCFAQWPQSDVDHENRNRSDNRLENLREATRSQNLGNTGKRRNNSSGYKGVWQRPNGRWRAELAHVKLGTFATAEEASAAYSRAARLRYGNHNGE